MLRKDLEAYSDEQTFCGHRIWDLMERMEKWR